MFWRRSHESEQDDMATTSAQLIGPSSTRNSEEYVSESYDDETPDRIRLLPMRGTDGEGGTTRSTSRSSDVLAGSTSSDPDRGTATASSAFRRNSSSGALHIMLASTFARRIGQLYAASTGLALISVMILLSVDAAREYHSRPDFTAFYSAAVVVVCTVVMSTRQIYRQLANWFMPDVQKYVVRILWMVPLYSIQSWCSLRFHGSRIYIDAVRDLYEAFVIQSFVYYLVELLGGEDELISKLRAKDSHLGEHQSVFSLFFGSWDMGRSFLYHIKYGVLQYVVLKTLCTFATVILEEFNLYGEGSYSFCEGYLYISTIINISQCWALYCLIKLFHATAEDLRSPRNWHPLGKFLCVKGVVFFTWWQSLGIFFLKANGIIGRLGNWDAGDVANGVQDYLICIEMLGFAIAHGITFTEQEYMPLGYADHDIQGGGGGRGGGGRGGGGGGTMSSVKGSRGKFGAISRSGVPCPFLLPHEDIEHNEQRDGDREYHPPIIRTLHAPMGIRDAFWSSTVPTEALEDIRRLRHGVSSQVMNAADEGLISLASMQHAEAI